MSSLALISLLMGAVAATSPYAPTTTACPSGDLIRGGNTALGDGEAAYIAGRKPKADAALSTWLDTQSAGLGASSLPTIALSVSGGGWRSLTLAAGVMQAMDAREDGDFSTSGLLQALTYQVGVSGGAWLLSSWAGNNFPTITQLKNELWLSAFNNGIEFPKGWEFLEAYVEIAADILAKDEAGYPISLTDGWARLLSYQMLSGSDGGVSVRLSDVAGYSNMTDYNVPMAIINSNGIDTTAGECDPDNNSTVWEYTPFEFGSWDDDVAAWIPIEYLGTAANATECTVRFDNLGFVLGMSSNLFAYELCVEDDPFSGMVSILEDILEDLHDLSEETEFGRVPNPFQGYNAAADPAKEVFLVDELYMVDGGIGLHNDPVAPLLEPARNVSVILLSDNSADEDNFPTGEDLIDAWEYVQNISRINYRMPTIPDQDTFLAEGLNKRAVFFGCEEPETVTIVYLPNVNYTYESNLSTEQFQYDEDVTNGMIGNGNAIATQDSDEGWGLCLACGIMMKESGVSLPDGCDACFSEYCYYANSTSTSTSSTRRARREHRDRLLFD